MPSRSQAEPGTRPVFLLGPARSGTSLLYKALCLHPQAGYFALSPVQFFFDVFHVLASIRAKYADRTHLLLFG